MCLCQDRKASGHDFVYQCYRFLPLSVIFVNDFGTVPAVQYFLLFIYCINDINLKKTSMTMFTFNKYFVFLNVFTKWPK